VFLNFAKVREESGAMRIDTNPALPDVPGSAIARQSSGDIIDIVESMLFENAGAERGTIPRAANKDGCFVLVQFMVAGAQLGHRDIDGAFDVLVIMSCKSSAEVSSI